MLPSANAAAPGQVWGVGALLLAIGDALGARFAACAVRGEISGFTRSASGHCYFSLKDANGAPGLIRCAMFRRAAALLGSLPRDGQLVDVRGRVAVYEARGELQLVVESLRPVGQGGLLEQFLRLKDRLDAAGLFDAARKRPLPRFPRTIGVVTSLGAAALHDVITALQRRAPQVAVVVYPCLVQGPQAPGSIVAALAAARAHGAAELLIVGRGGGSLEDLWAFNDEAVVRAVVASAVPVISGVGHDTDFTLTDFAADLRAPTPTAAAELAAPRQGDALDALSALQRRLAQRLQSQLESRAQRLDALARRWAQPAQALQRQAQALDFARHRMRAAVPQAVRVQQSRLAALARRHASSGTSALAQCDGRLAVLAARLSAVDPARVLARGYARLEDADGAPISSVRAIEPGRHVRAVLADGSLDAEVVGVHRREP